MEKYKKIVPDTSILIEGTLTAMFEKKEITVEEIVIHEASMAELEAQANKGRETGYLGLEEIKKLRELAHKHNFKITFKGSRPALFEINFAKAGEIDALIRALADNEGATLITGDRVQSIVAVSKGISVKLIEFPRRSKKAKIEKFFDERTMSVHLKEEVIPFAKKGGPGNWEFVELSKKKMKHKIMRELADEIIEACHARKDGFVEISRKGSTIAQMGRYRIVITMPPFSDGWEITAVRPVKTLSFSDYELSEKLRQRVGVQAEGILVAGSPGMGKSTFAQALAEYYVRQKKVVKTVEAPRDLVVPDAVTQYSLTNGSHDEIHDVLLLSRPDYTFFDEIRNIQDFKLFADLRLAGVGMVGVVHATNPIDAIQRFIGKIELGIIPQVIDTVVFIKNGTVNKVLNMKMEVKVPSGMAEADLARPIVVVTDFETSKPEFEIYTYGEQTVVIPIQKSEKEKSNVKKFAAEEIERRLTKEIGKVKVEVISENKIVAYVPECNIGAIIGKEGKNIEKIEQRLGMGIDVMPLTETATAPSAQKEVSYEALMAHNNVTFMFENSAVDKNINFFINGEYILSARVSKTAKLKIKKKSDVGRELINALNTGKEVKVYY
ncbi:MAG: PINc/VapC family ATPase [Candidatus Woesearchaeota archaeon]